jgi:hypothetical protein
MVSREELYELVWSMPMTKAAEKFSVLKRSLPPKGSSFRLLHGA